MNDPEIPVTRQKMKGMDVPAEETKIVVIVSKFNIPVSRRLYKKQKKSNFNAELRLK